MGPTGTNYTNGVSVNTLASDLERLIAQLPQHLKPARCPDRKPPKRTMKELNAEELAAIIADYTAGATLSGLASKYGYNRVGISGTLKQVGVQIRRHGLTQTQADEAERLYREGQSLAAVATQLGVDPGTVRTRLIKRGVTMRPASQ